MRKKTKKNENLQSEGIIYEFQKGVTGIFVVFMLGIFPLYFQDAYFNISDAKKIFFIICACGLLGVTMIFIFLKMLWNLNQKKFLKRDFSTIAQNWKLHFMRIPLSSWFAGIFLLAIFFSTIFSVDPIESFWGTDGRKLGTGLFLLCICVYFILGRYLRPGIWMAWIVLISNSILVGILILQFLGKDIFHMWDELVSSQHGMFLTTIGNVNACASYLCMILPIGMVLYYCSKTKFSKMIYGIFLVAGFYASYATNTDSWMIGIGVAFLSILWFSLKDHQSVKSFLELCGLFWISSMLLKLTIVLNENNINAFMIQRFLGLEIQNLMVDKHILLLEVVLLILCVYLVRVAENKKLEIPYKKIRNVFFLFVAIVLGTGVILFLVANSFGGDLWGDSLQWLNQLKLQDEFGSGRGIIWKHTVWVWRRLPFLQKFFGYGVNCFHQFYYSLGAEFVQETVRTVDPHNEILYFLSITGILGLVAYMGLLISTAISAGKMSRRYPVMMMGTVMICSYLARGMVNSPTTFIIPTFFVYLGILKSLERHYKEKDLEIENKL